MQCQLDCHLQGIGRMGFCQAIRILHTTLLLLHLRLLLRCVRTALFPPHPPGFRRFIQPSSHLVARRVHVPRSKVRVWWEMG